MSDEILGFIGLGNMGQPMARNIREKGHEMIVHDIAGTAARTPQGAEVAGSNRDIAQRAGIIALSLPTVEVNRQVVNEIAETGRAGSVVVDTCTIGAQAAAGNARILAPGLWAQGPGRGRHARQYDRGCQGSCRAGQTADRRVFPRTLSCGHGCRPGPTHEGSQQCPVHFSLRHDLRGPGLRGERRSRYGHHA